MKDGRFRLGIAARRYRGRQFGEQTSYLRGLLRIARLRGIRAYVFEPDAIDWEKQSILGWVIESGKWRKGRFPFPDVIHDRAWRLGTRTERVFREAMERMIHDGIPVFNPYFGDKLEMHGILAGSDELRAHLPQTLPLSPENLRVLAGEYGTVFAKPRRGRQGKGIATVQRSPGGWSVARQLDSGRVKTMKAGSLEEAVRVATAGRLPEEYLVQQGLELVKVRGGTVDIRVIVQRDRTGAWRVTGIGVRVGRRGGLVSNLHAGGRASTLRALKGKRGIRKPIGALHREIATLSVAVASRVSAALPTAGEIGLDLGLDRRGHLWVLEVNRQPGRALFSRAGLVRSWRRSRLRVVQFAGYLVRTARALSPEGRR